MIQKKKTVELINFFSIFELHNRKCVFICNWKFAEIIFFFFLFPNDLEKKNTNLAITKKEICFVKIIFILMFLFLFR